jgi:hypothetical protein
VDEVSLLRIRFAHPSEQEPPGLPIPVNSGFDHWEQLGHMLHFIQRDRRAKARNEAIGVAFGSRQNAWIIEGQILTVLACEVRRLHQCALPGLPGAVYENSWCIRQSIVKAVGDMASQHLTIINHNVDDNQPPLG